MTRADVEEPAASAPAEPAGARSGRHANATIVVLFLSLGGLSFSVLQSLVAPALPLFATDLHSLYRRRQLGHHGLPAGRIRTHADPGPARRHAG